MVGVLVVLAVGMFFADVLLGSYTVTFADLFRILDGAQIPGATFIVMEDKLPRAVTAVGVGIAFGVSGTIFQTMLRNPLASPDIIGISAGASASAVFAIVVLGAAGSECLARRAGRWPGDRAAHPPAGSRRCRAWAAAHPDGDRGGGHARRRHDVSAQPLGHEHRDDRLRLAQRLTRWQHLAAGAAARPRPARAAARGRWRGPVSWRRWSSARTSPARSACRSSGPGWRCWWWRSLLTGIGTAAAGPVAFVAFLAGPIARRLLRGTVSLAGSALVGALIMLAAEFVATNLVRGTALPVGVVTGALGAPFLIYLLVSTNRVGRGG